MDLQENRFLQKLSRSSAQLGLWLTLTDPNVAEALAGTGFDWLLIDTEHAPNDVRSVLAQLRAIGSAGPAPVVRLLQADYSTMKQYLDIGVQTVLAPMIESAGQAQEMGRAMRYPPGGTRGMGAALARASKWGQVADYTRAANAQMCFLAQIESLQGVANLEAIAAVPELDGVLFGPADLAASMGLIHDLGHPSVDEVILKSIAVVRRAGKAAGVIARDAAAAERYVQAGANFISVGFDSRLLVAAAAELARRHRAGLAG